MANRMLWGLQSREGSRVSTLRRFVFRLLAEDAGQDLIEYALLTATIGVASAAAWTVIGPTINAAMSRWNTDVYNSWNSPDPL